MKFRTILQKYVINNIGYKILAVVISFLLWVVVLNITDPDYTRTISSIPVQVINEYKVLDGTHVYTVTSGAKTSVSVTGKKSIVSTLSVGDFTATADFAQLSITNAAPISVELTGDKSGYSGLVTIVPKDTSMLINLENMSSKQIPVELAIRGELPENLVIDETNLSPKKVTISAPESITNSAEKVVVSIRSTDISEDGRILLSDAVFVRPVVRNVNGDAIPLEGATSIDEEEIYVEFKLSYTKSVPIKVSVSGIIDPDYLVDSVELSQDTITVNGTKTDIDEIRDIKIPGAALSVLPISSDKEIEVDVTPYLPENITVYGESPTVTVSIKVKKKETVTAGLQEESTAEMKYTEAADSTAYYQNEKKTGAESSAEDMTSEPSENTAGNNTSDNK
ncbi:MAG: hypothetical protein HUJ76_01910 [Parasporobacterium sp.]|nr:hypothetical protein [Parasporobacterium sp.]